MNPPGSEIGSEAGQHPTCRCLSFGVLGRSIAEIDAPLPTTPDIVCWWDVEPRMTGRKSILPLTIEHPNGRGQFTLPVMGENGLKRQSSKRTKLVLAIGLVLGGGPGWRAASSTFPQQQPQFQVDIDARLYRVRVTRPDGSVVQGLQVNDFQVRERGRLRPVIFLEEEQDYPILVAILVDTGSSMSRKAIRGAKQFVFELIHRLNPSDLFLLAVFDREIHFLSEITSDRKQLVEALNNLSAGARPGKLSRLMKLSASSSLTGSAIDRTLRKIKQVPISEKVVLAISAGFGNLGRATQDHLQISGVTLVALTLPNKLGDLFNLGGDRLARTRLIRGTGGLIYPGKKALSHLDSIREVIKHRYLIAFRPLDPESEFDPGKISLGLPGYPGYRLHAGPWRPNTDSIY